MKERILIVDDDKVTAKIAQLNLSQKGYEVFVVHAGMDAISFLMKQEVDLILMDIEMPIVNGMKTLELIRKRPELEKIPVIFLTASASSELVIEANKLAAVDYVVKPYAPQDLGERIRKALYEKGKMKQNS